MPAPPAASASRPLVRLAGIGKAYPGVRALDGIDLDFLPGEIHAVVGENGAGKSTLVKLLSGLEVPTTGSVYVDGRPVRLRNPAAARRAGVSVVPQETSLVGNLTIGRNVLLGRERLWCNKNRLSAEEHRIVTEALSRIGAESLTPADPAAQLSVAELRLCQIAATLIDPGRLLILDEPTAVLSDTDAEVLLERLARLRAEGVGILYISHRLGEVMRLADRVTVLRDGQQVGTFRRDEVDRATVLELMARQQDDRGRNDRAGGTGTGGTSAGETARIGSGLPGAGDETRAEGGGEVALRVSGLSREGWFADVTFQAAAGEVVGIAGIQGSGHGRLLEVIAGAAGASAGSIEVGGRRIEVGTLRSALAAGIRLVPAERRERGIVGPRSLRENLAIGFGSDGQRRFLRRPRAERMLADRAISELRVRAVSPEVAVATLSGGNQQKVVIARVLASSPTVLLLCEPTQGVDLHAKAEILRTLRQVAREQRIAVVLASCEFEELLEFTDRIHVMRLGRLVATLTTTSTDYQEVLAAAVP